MPDGSVGVWRLSDGTMVTEPLRLHAQTGGIAVHDGAITTVAGKDLTAHRVPCTARTRRGTGYELAFCKILVLPHVGGAANPDDTTPTAMLKTPGQRSSPPSALHVIPFGFAIHIML
jgi:hypothetical protein